MDINSILISFILFCLGTLVLSLAGMQDKTSRRPFLLIPAFVLIGASTNITTAALIILIGAISLLLPDKINKVIGKADVFLFTAIFVIYLFGNNIFLTFLLLMSSFATFLLLMKLFNKKNKKDESIPLITVFTKGYLASLAAVTVIGIILYLLVFLIILLQGTI